ncbi:mono-functional DNA-alkylating methyl methanesulfonate N-term-domain-containing protein [Lipomyces japonicus]|uniref:mono-functional DNA-alkylating methyl methanesulfonate N-term-domain-containing protein n=1 Tax=Lipomyces japonicus TaxID=56871 RepID=UPI0034CF911A
MALTTRIVQSQVIKFNIASSRPNLRTGTSDTLVLVSESRDLIFIVYECGMFVMSAVIGLMDQAGIVDLSSMNDASVLDKDPAFRLRSSFGNTIHSDAECNAIIVTSYQSLAKLLVLSKDGQSRKLDYMLQVEIDGVILNAKFFFKLFDPEYSCFAICYVDEMQKCKLNVYQWDFRLREFPVMIDSLVLRHDLYSFPSFVIPLESGSDLMMLFVFPKHFGLYNFHVRSSLHITSTTTDAIPVAYEYARVEVATDEYCTRFYFAYDDRSIISVDFRSFNWINNSTDTFFRKELAQLDFDIGTCMLAIKGKKYMAICTCGDTNGGVYVSENSSSLDSFVTSDWERLGGFNFGKPVYDGYILRTDNPSKDRLFSISGIIKPGYSDGELQMACHGLVADLYQKITVNIPSDCVRLFSFQTGQEDIIVYISCIFSTQVLALKVSPPYLDDYHPFLPYEGLNAESSILFVSKTLNCLLFITSKNISLVHNQNGEIISSISYLDGIVADYNHGTAAISTRLNNQDILVIYKIWNNSIITLPRTKTIDDGISAIKIFRLAGHTVCLIGTYKPGLILFRIDEYGAAYERMFFVPDNVNSTVPNSIHVIESIDAAVVLVGLRNGNLLKIKLTQNFNLIEQSSLSIGSLPIFLYATRDANVCYIWSNLIWRMDHEADKIDLHEVILPENIMNVMAISVAPDDRLICVTNSAISIFNVNLTLRDCYRSTKFTGMPKRMVYLEAVKAFAITGPISGLDHESYPIASIDFALLSPNGDLDFSSVVERTPGRQNTLALLEWRAIVEFPRCYLIVSLKYLDIKESNGSQNWIRIYKVFRESNDASMVKTVLLPLRLSVKGEVYAMAQLSDTELAYCSGRRVHVARLRMNSNTIESFENISTADYRLESAGVAISAFNNWLYVSTQQGSITVLKYDNGTLEYQSSDSVARSMISQVLIPEINVVIGSDKDNAIFGLRKPENRAQALTYNSMQPMFKTVLPSLVSRLRIGSFVSMGDQNDQQIYSSFTNNTNFRENMVICFAVNGSVYGLRFLTQEQFDRIQYLFQLLIQTVVQYFRLNQTAVWPASFGLLPKTTAGPAVVLLECMRHNNFNIDNFLYSEPKTVQSQINGDVVAVLNDFVLKFHGDMSIDSAVLRDLRWLERIVSSISI